MVFEYVYWTFGFLRMGTTGLVAFMAAGTVNLRWVGRWLPVLGVSTYPAVVDG